jgi:hypothetical protein
VYVGGNCMSVETSDFLFNRRDLEILPEDHVGQLSCAELWIGSVQGFRYSRYKSIPRVVCRRFEDDLVE